MSDLQSHGVRIDNSASAAFLPFVYFQALFVFMRILFHTSYHSYISVNNWVMICLMSAVKQKASQELVVQDVCFLLLYPQRLD